MDVVVVVGVGKGIGSSLACLFASKGCKVALLSRNKSYKSADKLTPVVEQIESLGGKALPIPCDATDKIAVKNAFGRIREELGEPTVLIYNAGARKFQSQVVEEQDPEEFEAFWKVNCLGAFLCAQQVIGNMKKQKKGTIIFTGATSSLRGSAGLSSFSVGKFGLRSLSQTLYREVHEFGIHVAHVIIDGPVDIPIVRKMATKHGMDTSRLMSPDDIATMYWMIHKQPKSCWTQEFDVRSNKEPFYSRL